MPTQWKAKGIHGLSATGECWNKVAATARRVVEHCCGRFPMIACIDKGTVQKRFRTILKEWTYDTDKEIEQGVKDGEFINEVGDEFYYYHVKVI